MVVAPEPTSNKWYFWLYTVRGTPKHIKPFLKIIKEKQRLVPGLKCDIFSYAESNTP